MKDDPLVSVVLPVYNRPSVVNTIDSVLKQTYKNFELLIIDNASTDATRDVINKLIVEEKSKNGSESSDRIHLIINEENKGQTYSINRGLQLSTGKYIARIDADDLMLPKRLEKQVCFMESNPDFGLVGGWVKFITLDDKLTITNRMPITDQGMRLLQTITCGMYHPVAMIRKSVLDEHNISYEPGIAMAEDYDMWRKIMQFSKACNLPEVLIYYRKGDNDSKRYAKIMHDESYMVRMYSLEDDKKAGWFCNPSEYDKMMRFIKLEMQPHKNLKNVLSIYRYYKSLIPGYLDLKTEEGKLDASIILTHMKLKVYSSCVIDNTAWWGNIADGIYQSLKKTRAFLKI